MKIADLIKLPTTQLTAVWNFCGLLKQLDFVLPSPASEYDWDNIFEINEIQIHIIAHRRRDSRRYWRIGKLMLKDKPIAVFREAGREGCDSTALKFLSQADGQLFIEKMGSYLKAELLPSIDVTESAEEFTTFYGDTL